MTHINHIAVSCSRSSPKGQVKHYSPTHLALLIPDQAEPHSTSAVAPKESLYMLALLRVLYGFMTCLFYARQWGSKEQKERRIQKAIAIKCKHRVVRGERKEERERGGALLLLKCLPHVNNNVSFAGVENL